MKTTRTTAMHRGLAIVVLGGLPMVLASGAEARNPKRISRAVSEYETGADLDLVADDLLELDRPSAAAEVDSVDLTTEAEDGTESAIAATSLKPFTCVGSAGTVDEADMGLVSLSSGVAFMKSGAGNGSRLNIRYNVVATDDAAGGAVDMTLRYRDNGAGARVIARLKSYNFRTGAIRTVLTFNSNDFPQSSRFQTQSVFHCGRSLDFQSNAYFIDVELYKSNSGGTPALGLMKVIWTIC